MIFFQQSEVINSNQSKFTILADKNIICGENLGKNQTRIKVNRSSKQSLEALYSALIFEPTGKTFSNSGS